MVIMLALKNISVSEVYLFDVSTFKNKCHKLLIKTKQTIVYRYKNLG